MTQQELIAEIRAFRVDLRETREAVNALARKSFWQKVFNAVVGGLFVTAIVGGWFIFRNAKHDRETIRHESCVATRTSAINARMASNLFFDAMVVVLVDPNDQAAQQQAEDISEELGRQQEKLLPIPQCD